MLSAHDKERIKSEEIFRDEVRQTLQVNSQSPHMKFLNSPFGIYLLSTVLVGVVSFSYTQWKDHHDMAIAHREKVEKLRSEMTFRIRQLDLALAAANQQIALTETAPEPSPDELTRSKKSFNITMQSVPVVVRLGGLGEVPGDLAMGTWVRFRDIDVQPNLLPFNSGYKSKDYAFETLSDIALDIQGIEGTRSDKAKTVELRRRLEALSEPAYKFLGFAAFRANTEYPIDGQPITSMHVLAKQYQDLLKPISDAWANVKESELVHESEDP